MEIELPRNTGTDGDGIVRDLREDSDIRDARYGAGPHKFFEMKLIQVAGCSGATSRGASRHMRRRIAVSLKSLGLLRHRAR